MATANFSRELTVTASPEQTWTVLTDVDRLAGWVGIVQDVVELSRLDKYSAVLMDRVGPFKLRANLQINVNEVRDGEEVEVEAAGRDRRLGRSGGRSRGLARGQAGADQQACYH